MNNQTIGGLIKMSWIEQRHAAEIEQRKQRYAPAPPDAEPKPDPVIVANCALLHRRAKVGLGKYGINLHDARYSERELIVHALQESLDLANYLQAQLQRHDRMADDGK